MRAIAIALSYMTIVFVVALAMPSHLFSSSQTTNAISRNFSSWRHLSPEIINELKDFLHLIPQATIDEIVAKHYVIDGGFRTAANYLRSPECKELMRNAQSIPDIIEILRFLQLENNNSSTVLERTSPLLAIYAVLTPVMEFNTTWSWQQQLANIIDNLPLQIELLPIDDDAGVVGGRNLYSFSSFVEEVVAHLPRDKYTQMINEKRQRSPPFAAFYVALRSAQFEVLVDTALKSPTLAPILQTLNSHEIYASSLKPIAFKVISWGPNV